MQMLRGRWVGCRRRFKHAKVMRSGFGSGARLAARFRSFFQSSSCRGFLRCRYSCICSYCRRLFFSNNKLVLSLLSPVVSVCQLQSWLLSSTGIAAAASDAWHDVVSSDATEVGVVPVTNAAAGGTSCRPLMGNWRSRIPALHYFFRWSKRKQLHQLWQCQWRSVAHKTRDVLSGVSRKYFHRNRRFLCKFIRTIRPTRSQQNKTIDLLICRSLILLLIEVCPLPVHSVRISTICLYVHMCAW